MASQVQFAGQEITAAFLNSIAPLQAVRSSTQSINTTSPTNDDTLFLSLAANATYLIHMNLNFTGAATGSGDLQVNFTGPSGATGAMTIIHNNATSVTNAVIGYINLSTNVNCGTNGASNTTATVMGTVVTSSGGTLHLQWCKVNAGSGTATVMGVGSSLCAWRLS